LRKRLLVVVLLGMLSLPLSALAGRTIDGGYCTPCDPNGNICLCTSEDEILRSAKAPPPKTNRALVKSEPDALVSGAFVLASLILLLLRTRTL